MIASLLAGPRCRSRGANIAMARILSSCLPNVVSPGGVQTPVSARLPAGYQQVRTVKQFSLQYRYGAEPLYTEPKHQGSIDQDGLESLSYKEIRFARLWETNSPLQDDVLEKFLRHMMHDGRRDLMYELLHKTFYEIKMAQFGRQLKKRRAAEEAAAKRNKTDNEPENDSDETKEIELNPMVLFHRAIENCKPLVITQPVRRGGATYQVPFPLKASQSEYLAMKWLNDMIKDRPKPRKNHYYEELAWEIIEAAQGRGKVVKKRDDIHKLAQANKAYAHYRWG